MARQTEQQILAAINAGQAVPAHLLNHLLSKIGRDQTKKRGRAATALTEADFMTIYNALAPADQAVVRTGVVNYVSSSADINSYLRTGAPATAAGAAASVDAMFAVYVAGGYDQTERISYRLQRYRAGQAIPYRLQAPPAVGGVVPPHIVPGDLIRDTAFWSTSENRQFIARVPNVAPGDRFVKFAIIGRGGINIAAHYTAGGGWGPAPSYSNANEALLDSMQKPGENYLAWKMRLKLKSRPAGQAEILYNRGTVFRVDRVQAVGNDFHVQVSVPNPQPGAGGTKNAFTGA